MTQTPRAILRPHPQKHPRATSLGRGPLAEGRALRGPSCWPVQAVARPRVPHTEGVVLCSAMCSLRGSCGESGREAGQDG